jgi:hypothetical protein
MQAVDGAQGWKTRPEGDTLWSIAVSCEQKGLSMATLDTALALGLRLQKRAGAGKLLPALWAAAKGTPGQWGKGKALRPLVEWGLPAAVGTSVAGERLREGESVPMAAVSGLGAGSTASLPYWRYMLTKSPAAKVEPVWGPLLGIGTGVAATGAPEVRRWVKGVLDNIATTAESSRKISDLALSVGKETGGDIGTTMKALAASSPDIQATAKQLPSLVKQIEELTVAAKKGIPVRLSLSQGSSGKEQGLARQILPYAALLGIGGIGAGGLGYWWHKRRAEEEAKKKAAAPSPEADAFQEGYQSKQAAVGGLPAMGRQAITGAATPGMKFGAPPVVPKSGGAYNAAAANTRFDNVLNIAGTSAGRELLGKKWGVRDLGQSTGYKAPAAPSAAPAPIAAPKPQQPANPRYTNTQDYQRALNRTGSTMQMVGDRMVVRGPKREAAMQPKAVGTAPVANAVNPATAFWPQAQQRLSTAMAQPGAASSTASAPPAAAAAAAGTAPLATAVNPATAPATAPAATGAPPAARLPAATPPATAAAPKPAPSAAMPAPGFAWYANRLQRPSVTDMPPTNFGAHPDVLRQAAARRQAQRT